MIFNSKKPKANAEKKLLVSNEFSVFRTSFVLAPSRGYRSSQLTESRTGDLTDKRSSQVVEPFSSLSPDTDQVVKNR